MLGDANKIKFPGDGPIVGVERVGGRRVVQKGSVRNGIVGGAQPQRLRLREGDGNCSSRGLIDRRVYAAAGAGRGRSKCAGSGGVFCSQGGAQLVIRNIKLQVGTTLTETAAADLAVDVDIDGDWIGEIPFV